MKRIYVHYGIVIGFLTYMALFVMSACGNSEDAIIAVEPEKVAEDVTIDSDNSEVAAASGMRQYTESSDNLEITDNDRNDIVSNKLPYIELTFSPEDFTVAGYSPADGDHLDEVFEIVSENLPSIQGNLTSNTTGWMYSSKIEWPGKVRIAYFVRGVGPETISYIVNRQESFADKKRVCMSVTQNNGGVAGDEYPLVESPVMPGITYEETLEVLMIENIVAETEASTWSEILTNPNVGYFFESQYGETVCRHVTVGDGLAYDTQIEIAATNFSMDLFFNVGILYSVDCTVYYELDE